MGLAQGCRPFVGIAGALFLAGFALSCYLILPPPGGQLQPTMGVDPSSTRSVAIVVAVSGNHTPAASPTLTTSPSLSEPSVRPPPSPAAASISQLPIVTSPSKLGGINATASLLKPVLISVVTSHFLGNSMTWSSSAKDPCRLKDPSNPGGPELDLTCVMEESRANKDKADCLWYHLPTHHGAALPRSFPNQLRVAFSMESSAYYPHQADKNYMAQYDLKFTYELDSEVVAGYFADNKAFHRPPRVPTSKKRNVVAYMNQNCAPRNGRDQILKQLMSLYPVEAYGCLKNTPDQGRVDKMEKFSHAKFCVAMENSNARDYVTEKLWHAFEAGCLPIYMGAPNIVEDFLPAPESIILYNPSTMTPGKLAEELKALAADDALYDQRMAWRGRNISHLSPGFQKLVALYKGKPHTSCQLCQQVALKRLEREGNPASRRRDPGTPTGRPGEADIVWSGKRKLRE